MKNLSLVLNIVLLVAVVVLYVLYFTGRDSKAVSGSPSDSSSFDLKIAYINSDSVLKYYEYLKVNKDQLEGKTKKMDQEYRSRAMGLKGEIDAFQRNINNMTYGQQKAAEEDLTKKQQNLQMYQQTLQQQLMEEEVKLNKALYDRVTAFLKKYGRERNLQVVFKFDPTSDILYGVEALDITDEVVKGLNEEYKTEATPVKTP